MRETALHALTGLLLGFLACSTGAQEFLSRPLFTPLDPRAMYGKSWFPEPLRAPEMDVENELRFDWFHSERHGAVADEVRGEVEFSLGLLTLEVEAPYRRDEQTSRDPVTGRVKRTRDEGIGSIELSARYPLFQTVTPKNDFEYTLVGAFEVAVPSGSRLSHDTEFVPQLFQLARFGRHVTLQASVGWSSLVGPAEGGVNTLEYAAVLGYSIERDQLRLPAVLRLLPLAEIVGERVISGPDRGVNRISATLGARVVFDSVGPLQPRLGLGYVLPLDAGARDEFRWGVITSLAFEF
jgi:hypothetical protein